MVETNTNDFSQGSMLKNILFMAIPMTVAQLVQVFYNLVDRIYIGHMADHASMALTGVGLNFPIISIISAFCLLFASGGAPLCSIERGRGNHDRAEKIQGNCFTLLMLTGVLMMVVLYGFMKPILYTFGASDATYVYAAAYLQIYLLGTLFVMVATGMNMFINAQGFGRIGMATTLLGAVCNIILDPVFIFGFRMGVRGAAIATVISQWVSAAWALRFLTSGKAIYRLNSSCMKVDDFSLVMQILGLGLTGFFMAVTNGLTQIVCNSTLQTWGGDLYVGTMTILNSIRELFTLVSQGVTQGAQPVLGYNYGAKQYDRVKKGIKILTVIVVTYSVIAWAFVNAAPHLLVGLFTRDTQLLALSAPALRMFFGGFFMMSLQFSGQSTFVALGFSKHAVFFSLLRKAVIVVPLTLLLPYYVGVNGVYYAEPISNYLGGTACFITMLFTVWPRLNEKNVGNAQKNAD